MRKNTGLGLVLERGATAFGRRCAESDDKPNQTEILLTVFPRSCDSGHKLSEH